MDASSDPPRDKVASTSTARPIVTSLLPRPAMPLRHLLRVVATSLLVVLVGRWLPLWALALAVAGYLGYVAWIVRVMVQRRLTLVTHPRWQDVMPCYLSVQDRDLRIVEVNEPFRRDFGEAIGEHCYRAYKHRETPCPNCPVLKTLEDGQTHTSEETVVTKEGETAHVVVTATPLHDRRGQPVAAIEMSTNVTELKTLRDNLERTRSDYQRLFDIVPCYVSIQNRDYQILDANDLFRQDFGEGCGRHCYEAYKGRSSVCQNCPVEKTFADGQIHSSEETVVTRDGREAAMLVHSMPIRDDSGEISAVMEVSTNVTEMKRLQHQLAMMGLAVAGMAHRVKNVLMGLEGGIFVVNDGFETDDQKKVDQGWEMVQRNVKRVSRVVKDLLYCSKEREPELVDGVSPDAIVREVHDLYAERIRDEGVDLVLELGEPPGVGRFDAQGIHTVVANLVANALDACRFDDSAENKKHRIVLRCAHAPEARGSVIEVSDNGAGIPEEAREKVFKGFFSTKGTEGTGLGLLIVQRIVEENGGNVSFTSHAETGTTFRLVFPQGAPVASSEPDAAHKGTK
ncbi:PAS domain-containing protein [Planctomycetota bacterium]